MTVLKTIVHVQLFENKKITFLIGRLDCEKVRKGLGDSARELSNTLLKNVVDTYRKENQW
jgi:hypothetical protein